MTRHYRPETYVAHESVGYLVRRLYTLLLARFEATLAGHRFTLTQWIVLMQLREGRAHTASDIAHDLQHDSGALTRVLDQLERRGLLERQRSRQDRRVVELRLTRAGEQAVRGLLPIVVDHANEALAPLSVAEHTQFRDMLKRLLAQAQQQSAPGAETALPRRRRPAPASRAKKTRTRRS